MGLADAVILALVRGLEDDDPAWLRIDLPAQALAAVIAASQPPAPSLVRSRPYDPASWVRIRASASCSGGGAVRWMWIHRSQMAAEPRWQDPVLLVTPSPGPSGSNCPVDGTLISPALCAHRFTPGTPVRALCRWPLLSLILSKAVLLAADD